MRRPRSTEHTSGSATIAYDAATGSVRWRRLYGGGGGISLAITPDGSKVIMTGTKWGPVVGGERDRYYLTIAYAS